MFLRALQEKAKKSNSYSQQQQRKKAHKFPINVNYLLRKMLDKGDYFNRNIRMKA